MNDIPTRPETMVERVAGAIEMLSLKYALRRLEGMEDSDPGQGIWEEFARAAIEAMMEPTGEMLEAGWERARPYLGLETTKQTYRAMIDAALGDG